MEPGGVPPHLLRRFSKPPIWVALLLVTTSRLKLAFEVKAEEIARLELLFLAHARGGCARGENLIVGPGIIFRQEQTVLLVDRMEFEAVGNLKVLYRILLDRFLHEVDPGGCCGTRPGLVFAERLFLIIADP